MKNKYFGTAMAVYVNYIVMGIGLIILAQHMDFLSKQLNTDASGVAYVISGMGIGKIVVLYLAGVLSDKYGRKFFLLLGMSSYLLFFGGILLSHNVVTAFIFSFVAGCANSFLDASSYPALMEIFPDAAGTANILIKAFIAGGQFILPILIGFLSSKNFYYGWTFILCAVLVLFNIVFMARAKFPKMVEKNEQIDGQNDVKVKPKFWIEGIALILIGFTSQTTFFVMQVWLPSYANQAAGMTFDAGRNLISYYSIGSLLAVFITAFLVRKLIKPIIFIIVFPIVSIFAMMVLWANPTPAVCTITSFIIGFTAAGGVLQLALTVMAEFFPDRKGKITGAVYTMCSVATFVDPVVTGMLAKNNISAVVLFDVVVTAIGVVLAIIVGIRYRRFFSKQLADSAKSI
jgi:MFS family permease